ncbi:YhgE/Pip domain-containing protein [Pseudonocardia kujensis]|uniref:YhgE/Pip family protein n=1 Tax=Pseudonocardia kujensis TaxID=1128675 RepID=UPI001E37DAD9|nr:YhgE/Pip domain-containing protein [Pseudonocardia kujensis]MCE0766810.1 YhgE/Pip domain-containing protein [Pseudonocardia kujensis]
MTAFRLAASEIRRFRTPLQRVALVFAVCVPLLYGALYLWSNWDPYNRLDEIPVAVVNEDTPVTADGKQVDAGGLFVDQLKADPIFDWRFVGAAEADRGVHEGDYYFEIVVPADFSAKLASGATGTPQRASMQIVLNDANGYVVGKMAQTVQSELQNRIDAAAVSAYFQSVFGNLDRLRAGVTQAADGAAQLRDGANQAHGGSTALLDGLGRLQTGADQLAPGARQVADGDAKIADVVVPLANRVADAIPAVAAAAPDAATRAEDVTTRAADAASAVAGGADSVQAALTALGQQNPELTGQPAYQAAVAAAGRAATRTQDVSARAGQVRDVTATVADRARDLAADAPRLQQEARRAAADVQALADGADRVADGAEQLRSGLGDATTGARTLDSGIGLLATGADRLASGLAGAVDEIPVLGPDQRERDAATLASPVEVTTSNLNPAVVYGKGIAPLFFSIALWVFGIVAFLLLEPLSARARASTLRSSTVALAGLLPPLGGALVAAALLYGSVELGLGLDPAHRWGTIGLLALGATAFIAIAHMLRVWLGGLASAVILVLLVLQLTTSGGVYPVETLPAPFRALHAVLPMSYLVDGLRVTLSGGSGTHLARDVAVLGGFLVGTLALTLAGTVRKRRWSLTELKPQLAL